MKTHPDREKRDYSEMFCNFLVEVQWISHSYLSFSSAPTDRKAGSYEARLVECACSLFLLFLFVACVRTRMRTYTHTPLKQPKDFDHDVISET